MNRLIFMNKFDESDLEDINNGLRVRFRGHLPDDYMAEINDGVLTVTLGFKQGCEEIVFVSIEDFGLLVESDSFFMMYEVAKFLVNNYDEDQDMREMFLDGSESCNEDCDTCGMCP